MKYTNAEWQMKWLAQQGELKQLREQVKRLQPFQDAYDDVCGDVLVIEQLQRAEEAEAELESVSKYANHITVVVGQVSEKWKKVQEENERLKAAIERIFKAQVYKDMDMHKGITLEMISAIRDAAEEAGLIK